MSLWTGLICLMVGLFDPNYETLYFMTGGFLTDS